MDLQPYVDLVQSIVPNGDSGSDSLVQQRKMHIKLAQHPKVKRICEIGFDAGGKAAVWLKANPTAEVIVFDPLTHLHAETAVASFKDAGMMAKFGVKDADKRLKIVKASSKQGVPRFQGENPEIKCDLLSIDGARSVDIIELDLASMFFLANPDFNILVIDHTNCQSDWCVDKAVVEFQTRGQVRKLYGASEVLEKGIWTRGVSALQYVFPEFPAELAGHMQGIYTGSWKDTDLKPYTELVESLVPQERIKEGGSVSIVYEREMYIKLAQMPNVKRICEIGFNAGGSAALWLKANPTADVIMFDLWKHPYAATAEASLRDAAKMAPFGVKDADKRLRIVKGSSLETVAKFTGENPEIKCDIVSVDGGHTYDIAVADLASMFHLANPDFNILLVDDTNCGSFWCVDKAVAEFQRRGQVRKLYGASEMEINGQWTRGISVLQYVIPQYPAELAVHMKGIHNGAWKNTDLKPYTDLVQSLVPQNQVNEGGSVSIVYEREIYIKLAQMPNVKRICEIGFNAGGSAALWLKANPTAEVIMFDLWAHPYAATAEASLRDSVKMAPFGVMDADKRLRVVKGSSLVTVPKFTGENPEIKCDIVSVDGGHTYDIAVADLENMFHLANPDFNILLVDDTNCQAGWCVDKAVAELQRRGQVRKLYGASEEKKGNIFQRGISVLQYIIPKYPPEVAAHLKGIHNGAWKDQDLKPYTDLVQALVPQTAVNEGGSVSIVYEREMYIKLAQMPHVKRICEIGFNAGGSAALWLKANPTAEVVMFDLWAHPYAATAEASLRDAAKMAPFGVKDADKRLKIVRGSSDQTIPQFSSENPDLKCDILSVDGGHTYIIALMDISNMFRLANPDFNILLVDDTNCGSYWCVDKPVQEQQRRGLIRKLYGASEMFDEDGKWGQKGKFTRGISVLQYIFE